MALSKRAKKNISNAMKARWAAKRAEKEKQQQEFALGQMPEKIEGGSYSQITGIANAAPVREREQRSTMLITIHRSDGTMIELSNIINNIS